MARIIIIITGFEEIMFYSQEIIPFSFTGKIYWYCHWKEYSIECAVFG
jgi:hypothetical protein